MRAPKQILERLREEFYPRADEFDRQRGVETTGRVWRWRLGGSLAQRKLAISYQAVDPAIFAEAIQGLPKDSMFVDLGCGKGRALILAQEHGFENVVGVEFSRSLCRVARKNVPSVPVHNVDAAQFVWPRIGNVVIFLYNPFSAEVLQRVVDNLREREVSGFVVYVNPRHDHVLFENGMTMRRRGGAYSVWTI